MLALLSGVRGSHLLCELGGCHPTHELACKDNGSVSKGCDHSHGCESSKELAAGDSPTADVGVLPIDRPCPADCWCQQSPQPLELPRASSLSVDVLLLQPAPSALATINDVKSSAKSRYTDAAADQSCSSSIEHCASLCRFLI
ncbi:hypothetical protein [Adhaeretor mobilis]|nr:hypothetical protein [Adhaeretor mobilis]